MDECVSSGDLEGLLVSGLSKKGVATIETFVDRNADVQTAALVVSKVVIPSQWTEQRKICSEWGDSYRSLLNTWRMWESRAIFDVERADMLRAMKIRDADGGQRRMN